MMNLPMHFIQHYVLPCCRIAICVLLLAFTSACALLPGAGKSGPSIKVKLTATNNVNPDSQKHPAPVMVRVYALSSATKFRQADYFSLQSQEASFLGSDLLESDEYILEPGQNNTLYLPAAPGARFVGVIAGYRNMTGATWKIVYPLGNPNNAAWYTSVWPFNSVTLDLLVDRNAIRKHRKNTQSSSTSRRDQQKDWINP